MRQRVEEAGFPSNLAQVPDFHCLVYGGCGQEPITAWVQGHVGHFLFVHSQIPKLQRRAPFRWGTGRPGQGGGVGGVDGGGWGGEGEKGRTWAPENAPPCHPCSAGSRAPHCLP